MVSVLIIYIYTEREREKEREREREREGDREGKRERENVSYLLTPQQTKRQTRDCPRQTFGRLDKRV